MARNVVADELLHIALDIADAIKVRNNIRFFVDIHAHLIPFDVVTNPVCLILHGIKCFLWLEAHETEPGEESPLGLLLCTEGGEEQIELLQLDKSGIKVAKYMTELPPREVLMQQIKRSLEVSRELFDEKNNMRED